MNALSNYVAAGPQCLVNLSDALLHELAKNIKSKAKQLSRLQTARQRGDSEYKKILNEEHVSIDECTEILDALINDLSAYTARRHESIDAILNADDALHDAFGNTRKVLDMVASLDCDSHGKKWGLGDCKLEMKISSPLFGNAKRFLDEVHEKFESVQTALDREHESFSRKRYILVSSAALASSKNKWRSLKLGSAFEGMDVSTYQITTLDKIESALDNLRFCHD